MRPPTEAASQSLASGMNWRGRLALTDETATQAEGSSDQHDRKCEIFHATSMTFSSECQSDFSLLWLMKWKRG